MSVAPYLSLASKAKYHAGLVKLPAQEFSPVTWFFRNIKMYLCDPCVFIQSWVPVTGYWAGNRTRRDDIRYVAHPFCNGWQKISQLLMPYFCSGPKYFTIIYQQNFLLYGHVWLTFRENKTNGQKIFSSCRICVAIRSCTQLIELYKS